SENRAVRSARSAASVPVSGSRSAASVPANLSTVCGSRAARSSSISTAVTQCPASSRPRVSEPSPGADLDDVRGVLEAGGGDDRAHGIGVDDEVLPLLLRRAQTDVSGYLAYVAGGQ